MAHNFDYDRSSPPSKYLKACIRCANCNQTGHVYRLCNHPITSFGVICFRMQHGKLQYLQIQRRDSLSYVEFLRGKYSHQNRVYVLSLLSNMTQSERDRIRTQDFDTLWQELWQVDNSHSYQHEYHESSSKFSRLCQGYYLQKDLGGELELVNLEKLLDASQCILEEPEWGWPKGRRNINEHDFWCALREFREETGVLAKNIQVVKSVKPFEEIFTGMNKVRYRHVYYLAHWVSNNETEYELNELPVDPANSTQVREVRTIKWCDYETAQNNIRQINMERKELFRRVHSVVQRITT